MISSLRCKMSLTSLSISVSMIFFSSHEKKVKKYLNDRNSCGLEKYPRVFLRQTSFLYKHTYTHTYTQNKPFPAYSCVLSPMSVSVICFIYMLYDLFFMYKKKEKFSFFSIQLVLYHFTGKKRITEATRSFVVTAFFQMKTSCVIKRCVTFVIEN